MTAPHPIEPFIPCIRATARRFGSTLQRPDREDLESFLALRLLQSWDRYDPARGTERRTYVINTLIFAARTWRLDRARQGMTHYAWDLWTRTPPGSEEWERLPEETRTTVLAQRAAATPIPLDSLATPEEGEDSATVGELATAAPGPTVEEEVIRRDEYARALRLLDCLTPRERKVILLIYIEGLTHAEVAQQVGLTKDSTGNVADRALIRLRRAAGRSPTPGTVHARVLEALGEMQVSLAGDAGREVHRAIAAQAGCSARTVRLLMGHERAARRLRALAAGHGERGG